MSNTTTPVTTRFEVRGMSCGHCVNAVSTEVGAISGVQGVEVDLPTGTVTVTSSGPIERSAVDAAVDEAGYQLV
ncbi:MAG TPA: cation transporter [Nocardioidaceae bacterium]|nr:cation transporter [Nocardioidaceae bacterium]